MKGMRQRSLWGIAMPAKRVENMSDLRRQRQRMRRIGVAAMLAAGLFALGSCEGLTRREAARAPPSVTSQITLHGAAAERGS
jgi:hypothetical protein